MTNKKYPFNYFQIEFPKVFQKVYSEEQETKEITEVPYIEFEGEKVYWLDEIYIEDEFEAMVELISANPKYIILK